MDPQSVMHRAWSTIQVKSAEETADGERIIRGIATTPSPDRMEDVVDPKGAVYSLPLPLLSQHDHKSPIGHVTVANVTDAGIEIEARIAKDSGLDYVERAWKQLKAGLVRGLSIGFRAIEYSFMKDTGGIKFVKWDWLELSAVTVPANADCNITSIKQFARAAAPGHYPRARSSLAAPGTANPKGSKMNLAEQIAAKAAEVANLKQELDQIKQLVLSGEDLDDDTSARVDELSGLIEAAEKNLASLRRMEKALGVTAVTGGQGTDPATGAATPTAPPNSIQFQGGPVIRFQERQLQPGERRSNVVVLRHGRSRSRDAGELVFRQATLEFVRHIQGKNLSIHELAAQRYPDDRELAAFIRAAQNPADTTTVGWAAELVRTEYAGFMDLLYPESIFPKLRARGIVLDLSSPVSIPSRDGTKRLNGDFVGEGAPIPVRGGQLAAIKMLMHKMAVISTFTRELASASTPQIQSLIQQFIQEDTAVTLDTRLLDNAAASAIRPAGLGNGVTDIPSSGNNPEDAAEDLRRALTQLANNGGLRNPVWLINPATIISASFMTTLSGETPQFLEGIGTGSLATIPYISSANVAADEVWLVDAADFVAGDGTNMEWSVSDVATIHEEDTTPLPIVDGTGAAAKPVRSLWQTYSVGVRMVLPVTWAMRRTGMVAKITGVHWGEPVTP